MGYLATVLSYTVVALVTLAFVRSLYLARSAHLSETESTDGNGVGQDEEASSQSPVEGEQEWYDRYGNADDHDAFFWDAEVSRSASRRHVQTDRGNRSPEFSQADSESGGILIDRSRRRSSGGLRRHDPAVGGRSPQDGGGSEQDPFSPSADFGMADREGAAGGLDPETSLTFVHFTAKAGDGFAPAEKESAAVGLSKSINNKSSEKEKIHDGDEKRDADGGREPRRSSTSGIVPPYLPSCSGGCASPYDIEQPPRREGNSIGGVMAMAMAVEFAAAAAGERLWDEAAERQHQQEPSSSATTDDRQMRPAVSTTTVTNVAAVPASLGVAPYPSFFRTSGTEEDKELGSPPRPAERANGGNKDFEGGECTNTRDDHGNNSGSVCVSQRVGERPSASNRWLAAAASVVTHPREGRVASSATVAPCCAAPTTVAVVGGMERKDKKLGQEGALEFLHNSGGAGDDEEETKDARGGGGGSDCSSEKSAERSSNTDSPAKAVSLPYFSRGGAVVEDFRSRSRSHRHGGGEVVDWSWKRYGGDGGDGDGGDGDDGDGDDAGFDGDTSAQTEEEQERDERGALSEDSVGSARAGRKRENISAVYPRKGQGEGDVARNFVNGDEDFRSAAAAAAVAATGEASTTPIPVALATPVPLSVQHSRPQAPFSESQGRQHVLSASFSATQGGSGAEPEPGRRPRTTSAVTALFGSSRTTTFRSFDNHTGGIPGRVQMIAAGSGAMGGFSGGVAVGGSAVATAVAGGRAGEQVSVGDVPEQTGGKEKEQQQQHQQQQQQRRRRPGGSAIAALFASGSSRTGVDKENGPPVTDTLTGGVSGDEAFVRRTDAAAAAAVAAAAGKKDCGAAGGVGSWRPADECRPRADSTAATNTALAVVVQPDAEPGAENISLMQTSNVLVPMGPPVPVVPIDAGVYSREAAADAGSSAAGEDVDFGNCRGGRGGEQGQDEEEKDEVSMLPRPAAGRWGSTSISPPVGSCSNSSYINDDGSISNSSSSRRSIGRGNDHVVMTAVDLASEAVVRTGGADSNVGPVLPQNGTRAVIMRDEAATVGSPAAALAATVSGDATDVVRQHLWGQGVGNQYTPFTLSTAEQHLEPPVAAAGSTGIALSASSPSHLQLSAGAAVPSAQVQDGVTGDQPPQPEGLGMLPPPANRDPVARPPAVGMRRGGGRHVLRLFSRTTELSGAGNGGGDSGRGRWGGGATATAALTSGSGDSGSSSIHSGRSEVSKAGSGRGVQVQIGIGGRRRGSYAVCPVCLEVFQPMDSVTIITCGHAFHWQCVEPWLKRNAHCPCCRQDLNALSAVREAEKPITQRRQSSIVVIGQQGAEHNVMGVSDNRMPLAGDQRQNRRRSSWMIRAPFSSTVTEPLSPSTVSTVSRRRSSLVSSVRSSGFGHRRSSSIASTTSIAARRRSLSSSSITSHAPRRRRSETASVPARIEPSTSESTVTRRRSMISSTPSDIYHQEDFEFSGRRVLVLHRTRHMGDYT